jgi:hypothetical protein
MGFWDSIYGGMRELFWFAIRHLMGYGGSILSTVIDTLAGYFPEGIATNLVAFTDYIDILNAWIPIDVGLAFLVTWVTAKIAILTVRHLIKMIPTVG